MYNLPWMLLYSSMAKSLFGRRISKDSALAEALKRERPDWIFQEQGKYVVIKGSRTGKYVNAFFAFSSHNVMKRGNDDEDDSVEQFNLWIYEEHFSKIQTIYEEMIDADISRFVNLVSLPDERSRRNMELLAIARNKIPEESR